MATRIGKLMLIGLISLLPVCGDEKDDSSARMRTVAPIAPAPDDIHVGEDVVEGAVKEGCSVQIFHKLLLYTADCDPEMLCVCRLNGEEVDTCESPDGCTISVGDTVAIGCCSFGGY